MKKLIFCSMLFGLALTSQAQLISKNAIGLRLSAGDGIGADVSYQRHLFNNNRLEANLGLREDGRYDTAKLVGLFHWVWKIEGGFNFYAGPGIGVGRWEHDGRYYYENDRYRDDGGFGLITGVAGVEYKFDFPLQLSFDIRPEVHLGDKRRDFDRSHNNLVPDVGLSARYTF